MNTAKKKTTYTVCKPHGNTDFIVFVNTYPTLEEAIEASKKLGVPPEAKLIRDNSAGIFI